MYVAIEGIDCCGKSTQIALLQQHYPDAIITKEPGGTPLGDKLRNLLLHGDAISPMAETFLFLADRAEHHTHCIAPHADRMIISDRSLISGIAYALHRPLDITALAMLNKIAMEDQLPDLVILLWMEESILHERLSQKEHDRIESRPFHEHFSTQGYILQAIQHLQLSHILIDAALPPDQIQQKIVEQIEHHPSFL